MKRKTSYFARVLSVFLAVLMCLSAAMMDWSSVLPEAEAISTGTHSFKVVTTDYYCAYNVEGGPAVTVKVDGTTRITSAANTTATWTSTSFPSEVYVWVQNCKITATVYCTNNGTTKLMSATAEAQAKKNDHGTDTTTYDKKTTNTTASRGTTGNPYLNSCGISLDKTSITASNYGTNNTQEVSCSAWAKDQYNVNYGCSVTWSIPTNKSSLSFTSTSGDSTKIKVPQALGQGDQTNTIRATFNGTNTADADFTVNNNDFYLDLNGYINGTQSGNISPAGTANVTVNGTTLKNQTDYCKALPSGSSYTIANAGANSGYVYSGSSGADLSGSRIGGANIYCYLWYDTVYTVKYDGNGATGGSTASSSHTYRVEKQLTANGYTKTGYTFKNWNTRADGTGDTYTDGQKVKNLNADPNGTTTLYAQWTPNTYYVAYDGNGNTSGSTATSTHTYDTAKNLTANGYARSYWTFNGWGTSKNQTSATYTNKQSVKNLTTENGKTLTFYALWKRGITDNYYYYDANITSLTYKSKSSTAYNADQTISVASPTASEVVTEVAKNDKTWTLKGWKEGTSVTWGGATPTVAVSVGNNAQVNVTGANDATHTFYPVYALKNTKFYANYNYYTDEASAYTTIQKNTTVNGDAATGSMTVPTGSDNGSNAEFSRYYTKDGVVYELQGWSLTKGGSVDVPYNSGSVVLSVPGAGTPTSTANLTPIELYPVYTKYATAIKARFHYYTDGGTDNYKEATGRAIEPSTTGEIMFPGADQVETTYTKNGRTYTLVGWNLVENSESYDTFGSKAELTKLTNPATDYYTYYPVYVTTTGINFHYFTNSGNTKVENVSTKTSVNYGGTSANINAKFADITVANDVTTTYTLYGRTYTLKGWAAANGAAGTYTPAASATALAETAIDADDLVFGTSEVVLKVTDNGAYYEFYPVYELTSTTFTAKLKYFTGDGSTVTTQDMTVTASGYSEDGTATIPTVNNTFKKDGITYQLTGWLIDGVTYHFGDKADNVPVQTEAVTGSHGTPAKVVEYTDATPIYKIVKKDLYLQFWYYNASGSYVKYDVTNADKTAADLSTGVTMIAKANVTPEYTTKVNGNNVTFTLKGWAQSNSAEAYKAFGAADTVALNAVDLNEHPLASANDVASVFSSIATTTIHFYPVYECTTTVRYHTYTSAGAQTSLTKSTTLIKTDAYTPTQATIKVAPTSEINNNITLDGRTFTFIGWRTDKTSADKTLDKAVADITLAVTDTEYQYYGIYSSQVVLTYNTTHDGITATPTAATQKLTQYINAGTGTANINNATDVTFDLNFKDIPEKNGYTFIGWSLSDSELEAADYTAKGTTKYTTKISKTMYARFSVNKQNVKFVYYAGSLTDGYTTVTKTVDYDDLLRDDSATNGRYVVTAPTVNKNHEAYAFADDTYHYYFTEWVRSDNKGIYTETAGEQPTAYVATFKNVTEDITIQAHYQGVSHRYEVQKIIKLATCTEDGVCVKKCLDCGYVWEDAPIENKGGHSVIVEGYRAPTCVSDGSTGFEYCTVCNTVVKEAVVIPATGHDYKYKEKVAPTCTSQGYDVYICNNNNTHVEYRNFVSACGHKPDTEDTSVAATCTAPGKTDKVVCTVCGTVIKDSETTLALGHTPVIDVAVAATCTETGLTEGSHCSVCDKVLVAQKVIAALGHDIQTVEAKEPTCTEIGWTAGDRCSRCDYGTDSETIPALGHDYGDNEAIVVPSTCVVAGTSTQYCERCKKDIVTELELADHTPVKVEAKAATCKEAGYGEYTECSVCGKELTSKVLTAKGAHTWVVDEEAVAATCEDAGHTASYKCSVCDAKIAYTVIEALDHKYSEEMTTVEATCTEKGETYKICARCGKEVYTTVEAAGHDYVDVAQIDATCAEDGTTAGVKCSKCGDIKSGCEVIPATGEHTFGEYRTLNDATCVAEGKKVRTCSVCGFEEIGVIKAKGHTLEDVKAVEATCTTIGYTAGKKCTVCGYKEGIEAVAKTAHKETVVGYKDATCTEKGTTGTTKCADCGTIIAEAREIPAKGHKTYEGEWKLVKAPTCTEDGLRERVCPVCGKDKETKVLEKLGHDMTKVEAKAPKCTVEGNVEYWVCSRCEGVYFANAEGTATLTLKNVVIDAEGHDWSSEVIAPKCTVGGYTFWTCSKCDDTMKTDETEATGHHGGTATCKDKAICEACNKAYGGYSAHVYETTTTEGTCVIKGTSTTKCTVCGKTETKETKYGDHDYDFSVTKVPTCSEPGVMTYECKYCGDIYTVELAATGKHTDDDSDGYCDDCGAVISGSTADHSGTCDKCGREHGSKEGGLFGYDGLVCKIIAIIRKVFGL